MKIKCKGAYNTEKRKKDQLNERLRKGEERV